MTKDGQSGADFLTRTHKVFWRRIFMAGCFFILSHLSAPFAGAFEVKGTLTSQFETNKNDFKFRARYDQGLWNIRVEPGDTQRENGINYFEYGYDGLYSYSYSQYSIEDHRAINTSSGIISQSNMPDETQHFSQVLWVAYCSIDYFKKASDHEIRHVFSPGVEYSELSGGKLQTYARKIFADPPHFLSSAEFFTDGVEFFRKDNAEYYAETNSRPFDKGFKMASYVVNAFANVNGSYYPLEFTFHFYVPNFRTGKTREDVQAITTWTGRLELVDPVWRGVKSDFIPVTDGATSTTDKRFPPKPPSYARNQYLNTNKGSWIAFTNKEIQGDYRALRGAPPGATTIQSSTKSYYRFTGAILVGLLVVVPIVVWVLRRSAPRHEK